MIAKHILRAVHEIGLMAGISIVWTANVNCQSIHPPIGTPLPDPPQVVSPFELQAINDPATGKGAFVFEGHEVPPIVRAVPGGAIQLEYVNQMPKSSSEVCVDGPCMAIVAWSATRAKASQVTSGWSGSGSVYGGAISS